MRALTVLFPQVITMPDIKSAVTSDCFIYGTDSLYAFIAMLLHGTLPNEFLVSILIPIPKGPRVDVRKTQNYRAIAPSSIIGKILDNIIITSQRNVIKNYSKYHPNETCVHWLDVYFLTCMVTNNSRYDGITVYLLCTK